MLSASEEKPQTRGMPGLWPWFLQRLSGVLLVFLLAIHIWMGHFAGLADVVAGRQEELVLFELVKQRLFRGLLIFVDFSLLALVLYHGLNGLRNILLEWPPAARHDRAVAVALWGTGLIAFTYGARVLLVFIA